MHAHKAGPNTAILNMPLGDHSCFFMSVDDTGECAKSILENPAEYKNKIVEVASEQLKLDEVAQILNKNLAPLQFKSANFTLEKFLALGFPGVDDLTVMFEYFRSGKMHRDIALANKLNPNLSRLSDWAVKNKDKFISKYAEK